jgi:hypothetical protein
MNKRVVISAALAVCASVSVSQAQIITNGSFEFGFDGWSASGAVEVIPFHSSHGTHSACFNSGDRQPSAVLTQTFLTVPGERYRLEFDFGGGYADSQRLAVLVTGGGVLLSNLVFGGGLSQMSPQRFNFFADATNTTLTIRDICLYTISNDGYLDNVSVEHTGLDPSIRVSQIELCWFSQSNRLYQVQYYSTLTTDMWTDLGPPIPGSSPTTCTNDAVAPGTPHRFYRVRPVP